MRVITLPEKHLMETAIAAFDAEHMTGWPVLPSDTLTSLALHVLVWAGETADRMREQGHHLVARRIDERGQGAYAMLAAIHGADTETIVQQYVDLHC